MMKILIIRTFPSIMDLNTYNIQEIGLARALVARGHECGVIFYNGKVSDKIEKLIFQKNKVQYEIKIYWLKGYSFFKNGFMLAIKKIKFIFILHNMRAAITAPIENHIASA